jgi:molybdopterin-guanine dinucleotide biosynthesis protein A
VEDAVSEARFSAVVLAGGAGTRMGCDKASLVFRGKTLRGLFDKMLVIEILVVGREPNGFDSHGADAVLPDEAPGAGPLGGIATGLKRMRSERGFFVACDMPLLDARVVSAQLYEASVADADAVVPVHDGRHEPLHAVYSKACLPAAERLIASGDRRVRALFEEVRTHYWDVRAAGLEATSFANVNTREDLAALEGTGE